MKQYICIDIGGTEIKHGVLDENEKFLAKGKVPTEAFKGGPALLKKGHGDCGGLPEGPEDRGNLCVHCRHGGCGKGGDILCSPFDS